MCVLVFSTGDAAKTLHKQKELCAVTSQRVLVGAPSSVIMTLVLKRPVSEAGSRFYTGDPFYIFLS